MRFVVLIEIVCRRSTGTQRENTIKSEMNRRASNWIGRGRGANSTSNLPNVQIMFTDYIECYCCRLISFSFISSHNHGPCDLCFIVSVDRLGIVVADGSSYLRCILPPFLCCCFVRLVQFERTERTWRFTWITRSSFDDDETRKLQIINLIDRSSLAFDCQSESERESDTSIMIIIIVVIVSHWNVKW